MMTFRQLQLRWQRDYPDVGAATAARSTGADELMAIFKLSPAPAESRRTLDARPPPSRFLRRQLDVRQGHFYLT